MKKEDKDFLIYYIAKRIIEKAEWDECRQKFYVFNASLALEPEQYKWLENKTKPKK